MSAWRFTVNGDPVEVEAPGMRRLLDVLREELALTGTKEGCGEGECGACTVLIDGEPVNSCLVPLCSVAGRAVETVESLGTPEKLSRLQQGFLDCAGAQCGICTPGMLMSAHAHLKQRGKADDASVREAISGNLCRCTGYQHIVDSVLCAARKNAGKKR